MTAIEAYRIVCNNMGEKPVVSACREYEDRYGFRLAAPGTDVTKPHFTGANMYFVFKNTKQFVLSSEKPELLKGYYEMVDRKEFDKA